MSRNIMTRYPILKLIYQHLLWLVFGLLLSSTLVVYLLIQTILYLVSSLVTWLLEITLHKEPVLESTQDEYVESMQESEEVKYNIQALFLFSKNLKQRSSAVLKMVLEEAQQLYTSLFGTRK